MKTVHSIKIAARPIPSALYSIGRFTLPGYPLAWVLRPWML